MRGRQTDVSAAMLGIPLRLRVTFRVKVEKKRREVLK